VCRRLSPFSVSLESGRTHVFCPIFASRVMTCERSVSSERSHHCTRPTRSGAECYRGVRQGCRQQSPLQQGVSTHLLLTGLLARLLYFSAPSPSFNDKFHPTDSTGRQHEDHWNRTFRAKFYSLRNKEFIDLSAQSPTNRRNPNIAD
jgi:hypothetical protein